MLSKEEIENMKSDLINLHHMLGKKPSVSTNAIENTLEYIKQLESDKQKLIKRLEQDVINITKTLQDGKHNDDYSRCRLKAYKIKTKEILGILKGENDE